MKKLLIMMLCMFSMYNVFANSKSDIDWNKKNSITCESCEKYLKNHYFSLDNLVVEKEQLYVSLDGKTVPIYAMYKDENGYFIKTWLDLDNDYCPSCGDKSWIEIYGCCSNRPSKCSMSCQNKY